jgi:aryl-alcohol dehydrogenase-like predicted oxidoreductase
MEYRQLGRTGLKVSAICLGTMQFGWSADEDTSFALMTKATELGCNFLDTADVYSRWVDGHIGGESEIIIGEWLAEGIVAREQLVLATKVRGRMGSGPNDVGLSRLHIIDSVEKSLRRLQTDYIDLYQVHFPDEETPLDETLEALDSLVTSGKVRYIGCSNYPAWLLTKSLWISDIRDVSRFDSLQPHYNYVHRAEFERELQPLCIDQGIGVIPYSPLGKGFLTGKYRKDSDLPDSTRAQSVRSRYLNPKGFAALDKLEEIGLQNGATIAQTAIAWVLANPAVSSAIVGANSVEQLEETVAGERTKLTSGQKQALDEVTSWQ